MELLTFLLRTSRRTVILAVLAATVSGLSTIGVLFFIRRWMLQVAQHDSSFVWAFAAVCAATIVAQLSAQLLLLHLSRRSVARLIMRLSEQVLAAPLRTLEELGPARVQATLLQDVQVIAQGLNAVPLFCANIAMLVSCLAYLGWLSTSVLLAVLGVLAAGLVVQWALLRRARRHAGYSRDSQEMLVGQLRHLIEGVQELKIHGPRRQAYLNDLQAGVETQERQGATSQFFIALAGAWGRLLFFLLLGFILIGMPALLGADRVTLGGYVIAVLFLMHPVASFNHLVPALSRARQSLERLQALGVSLSASPENLAAEAGPPTPWSRLELIGVAHEYRRERDEKGFTLGPLDLTFQPGEVVFLAGGNGSGKTTFVKLLTGLYLPRQGEIRLDGRPVGPGGFEGYRQLFSVVFSEFHLFSSLLGLSRPDLEKRTQEFLVQLHLDHKVKVRNGMFSTTALSRGQRKRLALLTAFMEDRPFYVFDEWAADQDPHFKAVFYTQILADLRTRGKAVLVVTHDDRYFHLADRLYILEDGKLRAGTSAAHPNGQADAVAGGGSAGAVKAEGPAHPTA
jgi:putative ATP-binding cassette transporter